jgi:hypothetical protein
MPRAKRLTPEQEAEMLFNLYHAGNDKATYELGCVMDNYIDPANRAYSDRKLFTLMYLSARAEGKDETVSAILRELQKGATPQEIAARLKKGGAR